MDSDWSGPNFFFITPTKNLQSSFVGPCSVKDNIISSFVTLSTTITRKFSSLCPIFGHPFVAHFPFPPFHYHRECRVDYCGQFEMTHFIVLLSLLLVIHPKSLSNSVLQSRECRFIINKKNSFIATIWWTRIIILRDHID